MRVRRPSAALVVAVAALFVSLSGTAWAALVITSNHQVGAHTIAGANAPSGDNKNLIGGSVGTSDLHSGSVTAAILTSNAVTGAKVAGDSLTGSDVKESTLGIVPNSGELGGLAPSAFLHSSNAARIDFVPSGCDVSTDACAADVLKLGGFTLHADCFNQNPNSDATLTLNANGPVGSSADNAYVVRPSTAVEHHAEQQGQIFTTTASGTEIPVDSAGTIVFQDHAGQTTVTVEFATHVIEHNTQLASCEVKGTALKMTG